MRRPQHISLVGPWLLWSLRFKKSDFEARRLRLTGRFEGDELNTLGTPLMVAHDLIKLAKLPDASILVDLGAGHGAFLVAGLLNGCAKVVGVEAHSDLTSGLRPLLPESTCELISGDCRELLIPTGNLYIAAWTTWTPQTRAQIRQQLQFVPKGAKLWVWTHEMEEPEWALRRVHRVQMPGYMIQVFLYEKV